MTNSPTPAPTTPHGGPATWTTALDTHELAIRVASCAAATGPAKGQPLEHLLTWLLPHVFGFTVINTNVFNAAGSAEVDAIVWNDQLPGGFPSFSDSLLVECKNWERPVDSSDVAWFDWKLRLGGASTGILVAANGITGDADRRSAAWSIVQMANVDGRRIVVVTLAELAALTSTADLRLLLIRKVSLLTAGAAQVP